MPAQDFVLSSYRRLLETALASGYQFAGYADIGREQSPRTCLLRHDIDVELLGCESMTDIENALGVKATYFVMTRSTSYNVFCVEARRVVARLLASGHRIGLHFMGELCADDSVEELAGKVKLEADWLEREFGASIDAVSFHQPSKEILDGDLVIPGLVNTYGKTQMGAYFYVSDTNMQWRHEHPAEIFERRLHPRLQLLIHPIWWTPSGIPIQEKWLAALRTNNEAVISHWKQRERTLKDLQLDWPGFAEQKPTGSGRKDRG